MVKQVQIAGILLALCAQWAPVAAQNVYRCGESYSNQPCAGGTVVPADDPRSAAQRAESKAVTRRDATAAQKMEQERLKQEAKPAQAVIPAPPVSAVPVGDATVSKSKVKKPELFTAVVPKKPGDKPEKKRRNKKAAAKTRA